MEMDEIKIQKLEVYAYHGVFPEENKLGQRFFVDLILYTNTQEAGRTDNLTASTHYGEVCHMVTRFLKEHTFRLIETAAEGVAERILQDYPLIREVVVEINKPQAPIGLPYHSVSVRIHRKKHRVFLAVGSNMGNRESYLKMAVEELGRMERSRVIRCSTWYHTAPYGVKEQGEFLNGAIELDTLLEPEELLRSLHSIEAKAGRERKQHWGPRTLDLDILFYDDLQMDTEKLTIPHIDMGNRDFVLVPLAQIAGDIRHPGNGKTVFRMLSELGTEKKYVIPEITGPV